MKNSQSVVLIECLRKLDGLERQLAGLGQQTSETSTLLAEIESVRGLIPTSILNHHDRMKARGKLSVAPVSGGVCAGCHLKLPVGHLIKLRHPKDLNVCDNCGAFIYLADNERTGEQQPAAPRSPKKTKRSR